MIAYFPVVGLIIGGLIGALDLLVVKIWPEPIPSLIIVILLAITTGALHIDGLGDTADGLFSHRSKEKSLEIMKDSRIGAMGMITVGFALAMKWVGIMSLGDNRIVMIVIIPCLARAGILFGFKWLDYGRPGGGTGQALFRTPLKWFDFRGLLIPVFACLFLGYPGVILLLCFGFTTALMLYYYKNKVGCITGDMLGAMIEITESVLFITASCGVFQ